jgi:hypothetical protein
MTDEEGQKILDSAITQLSEHFDAIQIVACYMSPDGNTIGFKSGSGNWFARVGMCQEFVETDQAITIANAINSKEEEEEQG